MTTTTDTSVRYYESTMSGAPVLDNQWGSLTALLKACLVTGFAVRSVTSATWADGVVTITTATPHGYVAGRVVQLSGAAEGAYNRDWRIATVPSATSFTVAVPSGVQLPPSATAASGQMEVRIAPLGWEMPFSGGHKAAFRPTHPEATGHMLLIDSGCPDGYTTSWAKFARVGIVQDMRDIDTPTGAQAPFDPTNPQRNWQPQGSNQWGWAYWDWSRRDGAIEAGDHGTGPQHWLLVGDGRLFYLCIMAGTSYYWRARSSYLFGDIASVRPGDQYHTALIANTSEDGRLYTSYPSSGAGGGLTMAGEAKGHLLLRAHTQTGGHAAWEARSIPAGHSSARVSGYLPEYSYPNGPDQALWLWPVYVLEAGGHWRGSLPGLYHISHQLPHADMAVVDNVPGQPGRQFVLPRVSGGSQEGQIALDITGPWR